ncbi:MAG: hypothetical protein ACP5KE_04405 [Candidatus Methanodesulfokora sp.]|jgi:SAM-dependent methyltransferase|nr:MAG: hypothetical protein C0200_01565 [Candidatus Korarchaeota archaeon]
MRLLRCHADFREVEMVVYGERAIHLGVGDSTPELLWSSRFFEDILMTDINEKPLAKLRNIANKHLNVKTYGVPASDEDDYYESLHWLMEMRKEMGLGDLPPIKARRIGFVVMDALRPDACCFDIALAFGFTDILRKAGGIGSLALLISGVKSILRPKGILVLSDLNPLVDCSFLELFGLERIGDHTFVVKV